MWHRAGSLLLAAALAKAIEVEASAPKTLKMLQHLGFSA